MAHACVGCESFSTSWLPVETGFGVLRSFPGPWEFHRSLMEILPFNEHSFVKLLQCQREEKCLIDFPHYFFRSIVNFNSVFPKTPAMVLLTFQPMHVHITPPHLNVSDGRTIFNGPASGYVFSKYSLVPMSLPPTRVQGNTSVADSFIVSSFVL